MVNTLKGRQYIIFSFLVILFLVFGSKALFPQTIVTCHQVYYDEQTSEAKNVNSKIDTTVNPDLNFCMNMFFLSYKYPQRLAKDSANSFRCDTSGKDSEPHTYTSKEGKKVEIHQGQIVNCYSYNEKGLLKRYTYSSCLFCAMAPFDYNYSYDESDRLTTILNNFTEPENYKIVIEYSDNNRVAVIKVYEKNKIKFSYLFQYSELNPKKK